MDTPQSCRDLAVLRVLERYSKDASPEGLERLLHLKKSLKEAGYQFDAPDKDLVRGVCSSTVCMAVVCAFSTSCDGSACVSNGCSALIDHCGFYSGGDPCSKATCASQSCGTGTGGGQCGPLGPICGYKSD